MIAADSTPTSESQRTLPSVGLMSEALHSSRRGHASHALEECDESEFYAAVVEARAVRILDFLAAASPEERGGGADPCDESLGLCVLPKGHEGKHQTSFERVSQTPEYRRAEALAAAPSDPAPLDVERLAQAWGNVMDGRRINSERIDADTTTPDDWQSISDEYARLTQTPEDSTDG